MPNLEKKVRYYTKVISLEMSQRYSCHLVKKPLKGVLFFHWSRIKAPFTHKALLLVKKLSAGGFLSIFNKTKDFIMFMILRHKEKEQYNRTIINRNPKDNLHDDSFMTCIF